MWCLLMTVSCSDSTVSSLPDNGKGDSIAVSFSTYLQQSATTRAYRATRASGDGLYYGNIDTADSLRKAGVGIFAYYTDNSSYDQTTNPTIPNFMYNQLLSYNNGWTYSPVVYWPDEFGASATSTDIDRLSFFAYAPYTPLDADVSGYCLRDVEKTSNTTAADPMVTYVTADSANAAVDLLWGVVPSTNTTWKGAGSDQTLTAGKPYLNLTTPTTSQNVNFQMKHALCRVGLTVRGDYDNFADGADQFADSLDMKAAKWNMTLVLVDSVMIEGNWPMVATLNLNNTTADTPLWLVGKNNDVTYGWYGKYYSDATQAPASGAYGTGFSTTVCDKHSIRRSLRAIDMVADKKNDWALWKYACKQRGVPNATSTSGAKYLLEATAGSDGTTDANKDYFMFIPDPNTTKTVLRLTVVYDVITKDDNLVLSDGYHVEKYKQTITKTLDTKFAAGNTYMLNLVLKLNSIDFTVTHTRWYDPIIFNPSVDNWNNDERTIDFSSTSN